MKTPSTIRLILCFCSIVYSSVVFGQYCDSLVPSFNVDLSAAPNMSWVSPPVVRDGNCCGTTNPDNCLEFIITLHPSTIAVQFNIASGAIPPGALFYQIDCGPPVAVGSPICLDGPGPHHLTFCKPGNNNNTFSIESFPNPIIGPNITLSAGCQGEIYASYYNEPSIVWTSIAPGAQGDYDGLLGCTSGCDTTIVNAPIGAPAFVDYLVCGMDLAACNPEPICDTIRVNFIPPVNVVISASTTVLCEGELTELNAIVSGGTGPYSVLWSTGETTNQIFTGGGVFSVQVTDSSGCYIAMDDVTIIENLNPPVTAGVDQTVCEGTSVTLSGSGATTYAWDNGITDGVGFVPAVGSLIYTVIGTDGNGCSATDQVLVTVNPNPIVNAGIDQTVCEGTGVTLSGSGATTYSWDNGITDGVGFVPAVGTLVYTVIGTDGNGCFDTDQVQVTVNPNPIVNAGVDQTVCEGTTVTLSGSGATTYTWDNGVMDGVGFVPAVGTVSYTVIGTDGNGCFATDQVQVAVNPNPVVSAGPDQVVCEGTTVTLSGSGATSYSWNNGITNGIPFVPAVGTHLFTVTGSYATSCFAIDAVQVIVNPNPVVNAGPDQTVCYGTEVTFNATGSANLVWSSGVINNQSFGAPLGTSVHIVYDTLATGCFAQDDLTLIVHPNPFVNANSAEICEGESVVLSGSGAVSYDWSNGVINNQAFQPTASTTYSVIGYDANGCSGMAFSNVIVHENPTVSFTWLNQNLTMTNPGTNFLNHSEGAVSYSWDFGDWTSSNEFEPYHEFPDHEGGEYWVTLEGVSEFGCVANYSQFIQVVQDYSIFVPNAFTPDNNGVNEIFNPVMFGFDPYEYTLLIFNRWGQILFESHNMEVGWDGTLKNQSDAVQDGVYTWKVTARVLNSSEIKAYTGHVSILK